MTDILVENLYVALRDADVVRDISFSAGAGKAIGPNGAGKSTLIRAMARLLPARSGHVLIDGRTSTASRPANSPARSPTCRRAMS